MEMRTAPVCVHTGRDDICMQVALQMGGQEYMDMCLLLASETSFPSIWTDGQQFSAVRAFYEPFLDLEKLLTLGKVSGGR